MNEYLVMLVEDERQAATQPPAAMAELIARRAEHVAGLRTSGQLLDAGQLRPSATGKRLRKVAGQLEVRDGPFDAGGSALGAYQWVTAATLDEALALAGHFPRLPGDRVEVRPLMGGRAPKDKDSRPGKVFACVVLGAAANEAGWVSVMDRIEADTSDGFPDTHFLGGARLERPSVGRSVGGRVGVLDAPFLESKEVVGGVFFMQMNGLDELTAWAAQTPFVVHGALELRELWRS
ncbi:MAG: YciI family protein [Myxococcaceae bacterium]|nr:YciI family protein [Myxococcaceae bacterium]